MSRRFPEQKVVVDKHLKRLIGQSAAERLTAVEANLGRAGQALEQQARATLDLTEPLRRDFLGRLRWLLKGV